MVNTKLLALVGTFSHSICGEMLSPIQPNWLAINLLVNPSLANSGMINFNYSAKQLKGVNIAKLNNNGLKCSTINMFIPFLLTYECLTINHY